MPTAKLGSNCLLYAGLGFEAGVGLSSQVSQRCRAEVVQRICNLSSPEAICAATAFLASWGGSIFMIFPAKEFTLYTDQISNTWAWNYSLSGSFEGRKSSLIFIFFHIFCINHLTEWIRQSGHLGGNSALLPPSFATPKKLPHFWKFHFLTC